MYNACDIITQIMFTSIMLVTRLFLKWVFMHIWNINFRDLKASGIYVVLYNLMSGNKEDKMSPLRIIFAGGLAGQIKLFYFY